MKTKIYISLSILLYSTFFSLVYINTDTILKFIGISILSLVLYVALEMFTKLMIALISDNPNFFNYHSIVFSPILLFLKRIHYNGLQNLYMFKKRNRYYIFQYGYFFLKEVCTVKGVGDINEDIKDIKSKIEESFKEQLNKERLQNKYKKWDGAVDTYSRRVHSVDELLN
jgi:hypothetical protein